MPGRGYRDGGISGAKGRDQRPGLDGMLKDAGRRRAQQQRLPAQDQHLSRQGATVRPLRNLALFKKLKAGGGFAGEDCLNG
jgi:hypothetical protein